MSAKLDELAAQEALLVAASCRLRAHAGSALRRRIARCGRPAGLIGGAVAKPAAAVALVEAIAPLFGLRTPRALGAPRLDRVRRCSASRANGAVASAPTRNRA